MTRRFFMTVFTVCLVALSALADGKQADSYRRGMTVVKQTYTDGTTSTRKVIK